MKMSGIFKADFVICRIWLNSWEESSSDYIEKTTIHSIVSDVQVPHWLIRTGFRLKIYSSMAPGCRTASGVTLR